jgi:hypothetical protein
MWLQQDPEEISMRITLRPRTASPIDSDLETWARNFILSPAANEQERRERRIVAELLADVEASR